MSTAVMRKGILEQLGRYLIFITHTLGCDLDKALAEVREWANNLLINAKNNTLSVENAVSLFRWLREPQPDDRNTDASQANE
jgi:hypothetical protein